MASNWNYSSFVPSLKLRRLKQLQRLIKPAIEDAGGLPHGKFAICSITVRRTNPVHQLKEQAPAAPATAIAFDITLKLKQFYAFPERHMACL
jgi:hypothetical protein